MIFDENYIDFINLLNQHQVKYVLVGGLAVVVHGHYRSTKDMDIFYEASNANVEKLLVVINLFGFGYLKLSKEDLLDKNGYIKLGNNPVRVDLFCELPGISFEDVFAESILYKEEEMQVNVIHINHLIQNKTKVGRFVDLDDVKKLRKILQKKN